MAPLPLQLSSRSSSPPFPSLVALLSASVQASCDSHHPSTQKNIFTSSTTIMDFEVIYATISEFGTSNSIEFTNGYNKHEHKILYRDIK